MARFQYSSLGIVAIVGGVILTGIEVAGAVSFLVSQNMPHYLILGGAMVTIVAAALPVLAARSWRDGRYVLAVMLWAALAPALSVIVTAAIDRVGSASDHADRGRQASAQSIELARTAAHGAKVVADADELAAKTECATGRGSKCQGLEVRADTSRQRLEAARAVLAQAGIAPRDPMASRLAAVLPGVSEEAIRIVQPLVLPLSISALGLLLIAAGAHHQPRRKVQRKVGKRKRRRRRKAAASQPSQSNVIRLRK
jgi:hypothetical protein